MTAAMDNRHLHPAAAAAAAAADSCLPASDAHMSAVPASLGTLVPGSPAINSVFSCCSPHAGCGRRPGAELLSAAQPAAATP
jgi:hypothetical protein